MTHVEPVTAPGQAGLRPLYAAARAQWGLVAALVVLAGVGWWWTARAMSGMDAGPWSGLGGFSWFIEGSSVQLRANYVWRLFGELPKKNLVVVSLQTAW